MLKKLLACLVLPGLVSCATMSDERGESDAADAAPAPGEITSTDPLAQAMTAQADEELGDPEESAAAGYCSDDIYATYLRAEYTSKTRQSLRSVRSHRAKSKILKKSEIEAHHHARRVLNGPMASYFGGLPVVATPLVEYWLHYFKSTGRQSFMKWMVRGESYRTLVEPLLRQEGLPVELFYLAMIESGFNNTAYSRASATGTWQFMSSTARHYGLTINYWVDERRDPIKSTLAAARYLRDLYTQFGDWYLAIAAYNAGPGTIRRAVRLTNSRDFWKLASSRYLRIETKQYVPKILGALIIASNPKVFGFNVMPNPADATPETIVGIDRPTQISEIALKLGVPLKELRRWNPELIRDITPPPRGGRPYTLRIPAPFDQKFAQIAPTLSVLEIKDVKMYRIKSGDTLSTIARRHKVGVKQILTINPKLKPKTLRIGREIAIPIPAIVVKKPAKDLAQQ